jgi:MFS family permease
MAAAPRDARVPVRAGVVLPFSAIHFHNVLGIPLSLVGVGLASLAVASVLSGLVSGPLTDRYGRKPVMLLALAGSAASFFAFSLVDGFAGYLAVSILAGLAGSAMFDAARNAMVADVTPPGRRSRAYGLVRVGGNVGWALGPMTAGVVSAAAGGDGDVYRALFTGTAVLTAAVMLVLAFAVRESLPSRKETARRAGSPSGLRDGPLRQGLRGSARVRHPPLLRLYAGLAGAPVYARNFVGVPTGR